VLSTCLPAVLWWFQNSVSVLISWLVLKNSARLWQHVPCWIRHRQWQKSCIRLGAVWYGLSVSSGTLGSVSAPPPALKLYRRASSHSSCDCCTIKSAKSSEQLLLHSSSQTLAGWLGNYLGADLLEEEEPMGISVPPFLAHSQSRGSAHNCLAWAAATLPWNTAVKETSPIFRWSGKNKAYRNAYFGIKPFQDETVVGISTGATLPLVFLQ